MVSVMVALWFVVIVFCFFLSLYDRMDLAFLALAGMFTLTAGVSVVSRDWVTFSFTLSGALAALAAAGWLWYARRSGQTP